MQATETLIKVKRGLDIPIAGAPKGAPQSLSKPKHLALNLDPFDSLRFKVHVKVGDRVKCGQPIVENKAIGGQMFVAPAGGVITEVRRGLKRRLLDVVIAVEEREQDEEHEALALDTASREEIVPLLMKGGAFPYICLRPFNLIADPQYIPRDIFVSAVESLPFVPSAEMQVEGHEEIFQAGLHTLQKLTPGRVHLVHRENSPCTAFTAAQGVETYAITGPHPAGSSSLHIQQIAPIRSASDFVWALTTIGVLTIGKLVLEGKKFTPRVLSIAGNGIIEERRNYLQARDGFPIADLIANRLTNAPVRLISGDPLTGTKVESTDFLGFHNSSFTAIPENVKRQAFHFFRPGFDKFSATRAYFTGHVKPPERGYPFTTNQHGEERAFIDGHVYNKVMPLRVPTMHLIKAILVEDFELAEQLGLLEVAPEDFALSTFICPSKIEMMEIVKKGLHSYAKEMGH